MLNCVLARQALVLMRAGRAGEVLLQGLCTAGLSSILDEGLRFLAFTDFPENTAANAGSRRFVHDVYGKGFLS